MIIKKKLRDLTFEEYKDWKFENCIGKDCARCAFGCVNCSWVDEDTCGGDTCWINNKDSYSDKFLNQEINIPDILDKQEKEYLQNIIRSFRKNVDYIHKELGSYEYEYIFIEINCHSMEKNYHTICLPPFPRNSMYKNMENACAYTLAQLKL